LTTRQVSGAVRAVETQRVRIIWIVVVSSSQRAHEDKKTEATAVEGWSETPASRRRFGKCQNNFFQASPLLHAPRKPAPDVPADYIEPSPNADFEFTRSCRARPITRGCCARWDRRSIWSSTSIRVDPVNGIVRVVPRGDLPEVPGLSWHAL
jgi:hypothetical protein